MAWEDDVPIIVRTLLQDVTAPHVYTTNQILQMSYVTALTTSLRRRFSNAYTISVVDQTVDPDPTEDETRDDAFVVVTAYRAAINFLRSEVKAGLSQVVKIKDGDSELDFDRDPAVIKTLLDDYEAELADVLWGFDLGGFSEIDATVISSHRFLADRFLHYWHRGC